MPRFSKDPRTFPDVCHTLLLHIKQSPQPSYIFNFKSGREADQFKALLNAFRNAWAHHTQKLRTQRAYPESAAADENYVLLGTYGIHLSPAKTSFSKEEWALTPVAVQVISKSDMPVYASAMSQLLAQAPPLPTPDDSPEDEHRLSTEEELEAFKSAPLLDLDTLIVSSPSDPYAHFRPGDDE